MYVNLKTNEEYLRELERAQTDRQTECINTFQLYWNVLKIRKYDKNFHITSELVDSWFSKTKNMGINRLKRPQYLLKIRSVIFNIKIELSPPFFSSVIFSNVCGLLWPQWLIHYLQFLFWRLKSRCDSRASLVGVCFVLNFVYLFYIVASSVRLTRIYMRAIMSSRQI